MPRLSLPEIVERTLGGVPALKGLRHVAAAVSGGADSTAMAVLLRRLIPSSVSLTLVRIDHILPEAEGPAEGLFTRQLAERLECPWMERRVDVRSEMARTGESLEMAARRLRHDALRNAAREVGADAIALGHNADDQVEGLLLRLARGTGPRGLGGMPVWRPPAGASPGVLRPLLSCPRSVIRDWLRTEGFSWCEDPTNEGDEVQRNRIRHHVLPALYAALGESAREGFLRTAGLLRDEESAWLAPLVEEAWMHCRLAPGRGLDAGELRNLPPPLARRVLLREIQSAGLSGAIQTEALLRRVAAFAVQECGGTRSMDLGEGFSAKRVYGEFRVIAPSDDGGAGKVSPMGDCLVVTPATGYLSEPRRDFRSRPLRARLSRAEIPDPSVLHVRGVRPGDRIRPVGAKGSRKVSDILVDRKVPRDERGTVVVVCAGDRVAWLPGHSIDASFAVETPESPSWDCVLEMTIS